MRRFKTYALALMLCITSVGALSSNDLSDGSWINLRHYGNEVMSIAQQSLHYVSASLESTFSGFESAQNGSKRASTPSHDDTNLIGTLVVVTLIAGFAIVRRLD